MPPKISTSELMGRCRTGGDDSAGGTRFDSKIFMGRIGVQPANSSMQDSRMPACFAPFIARLPVLKIPVPAKIQTDELYELLPEFNPRNPNSASYGAVTPRSPRSGRACDRFVCGGAREIFGVGFGVASEIEHALAGDRDDVSGAARAHDLVAEA